MPSDDAALGSVMTLLGIACGLLGFGAVVAGLIASGHAAVARRRTRPELLERDPEQQAIADAIRAEIQRLGRDVPSTADVAAYQRTCDVAFKQLVTNELRDVEDVAHRFYEEAS